MKGVIYKATNIKNGEGYAGQSIDVMRRIKEHKKDAKRGIKNTHFYNAIRLYGWDAFEWEVLYHDIPESQLSNMERWCIANHDTYHNGYNSTEGGDESPMKNPESRKKVSISRMGELNPMFGKPISDELKARLSKANERFEWEVIRPDGTCETTTNMWKYCRENTLDRRNMFLVAAGKRKQHKGFKCSKLRSL